MSTHESYKVGDTVVLVKSTRTLNNKFERGEQFTVTGVISSKVDLKDREGRNLTIPTSLDNHIEKIQCRIPQQKK